jgi:NitT/TauT family transport system substrate-binding protein
MRKRVRIPTAVALAAVSALALAGCTVAGGATGGDAEQIVIGYQSKTINTVTAGTLLRAKGFFEKRLAALGARTGKKYSVVWQDYDTGAPITAQMMAGKIDIGSMGDYPMLINLSSGAKTSDTGTEIVSATGYNARGALNSIVVAPDSTATSIRDLAGKTVSTSVGSAGDGLLVRALTKEGIDPTKQVKIENQTPSIGASALQAGSVDALSQFVAWPGQLVFQNQAKLLYDGGQIGFPTFHGVVVRDQYADDNPDIVTAFLQAQMDATKFLWAHPLQAAEIVAKATGLPPEVVYLYNGRNGIATFDPTLKPLERNALVKDVPFLQSIGVLTGKLDVSQLIDDSFIRKAYGSGYDAQLARATNPAAIKAGNPSTAGEIWFAGASDTQPEPDPTTLLKAIKQAQAAGKQVRAAYIPDATTGTRWFANKCLWVRSGQTFEPFATQSTADAYVAAHPGTHVLTYQTALEQA